MADHTSFCAVVRFDLSLGSGTGTGSGCNGEVSGHSLTVLITLRQVYKALRHGTSDVAVKHIPCVVDDPQKLHQLRREVAIMQRISYDANVVQYYGACMSGEGAWLCMEYMEVGA